MMTDDDDFRWDCIKGTRAIKDEIDAEIANLKGDDLRKYLHSAHIRFTEYITSLRAKEGIVL